MKLTETAIERISEKTKQGKALRSTLALALSCTDQWITISVKKNKENGILTTYQALQIISKGTGLNKSQILEESEPVRA